MYEINPANATLHSCLCGPENDTGIPRSNSDPVWHFIDLTIFLENILVLAILIRKKTDAGAAFVSMTAGGTTTLALTLVEEHLPLGLAPNLFGLSTALVSYII
ncbi:MAG: hypothetical protein JW861_04365 [Bacteroidales bacterium]|nr:hypothetical protein [Bacteroidales bacterium]